jgi:hypothetical protein
VSWAAWREEFAKACDGSHWTIEAIEAEVASGDSLPLYGEGCCFIVQVHQYPQARACQITWAAGTLESILAELPKVQQWARSHGCTEMLVEGHLGWQRALKSQGYRPWSVTLRKPINGH